ncbi:MAG: cation-transporting P-type ATPase, partial [Parascardovia denticolens]
MATVQNFFNGHKKHDLILMTILLALALIGKVAHIPWLFTAGMILAAAAGGIPLLLRAISSLRYKVISIELLVSIAVIGAIIIGEYSEAGIVVWLFSLGDLLEEATLEKTRQSIKDLVAMAPKTALKIISPVDRDPIEVD